MDVLCLDLEGVLVPELWMELSTATGVKELGLTTRDIADYDELMSIRIKALDEHDIGFDRVSDVLHEANPFPGAAEFLGWARSIFQVSILSDTFYEFAMPVMKKLNQPFLLCHHLIVENNKIKGYRRRQDDPKTKVVNALRSLALTVYASGDSYNDVGMISAAHQGWFFNPPQIVMDDHPSIEHVANYDELRERLITVTVSK